MKRIALVIFSLVALVACDRGPGPLALDPNVDVLSIPSFTLTDQTGAERTRAIFRHPGVTVLDFTFTSCPFICPVMNANMLTVQRETAGLPVRMVSISVDPERDTPEKLAQHAASIGADTERWTFLTGDFETIERVCRDGLKLPVGGDDSRAIDLGGGETMQNIPHSGKFILIRGDGVPIGVYEGTSERDVSALIARVKAAF